MHQTFLKSRYAALLMAAVFLISGCSGLIEKSDTDTSYLFVSDYGSLDRGKTYAIASIAYDSEMIVGTSSGTIGDADDVRALATKLESPILRTIQSANSVKFIPVSKVASNPAYKSMPSDSSRRRILLHVIEKINLGNIKYFTEEEKFGKISSALKADGVLDVSVRFGASVSGIACAAKFYASTALNVVAYDKQGKKTWGTVLVRTSKEGIRRTACLGVLGLDTKALVKEMAPLFVETTNAVSAAIAEKISKTAK